MIYRQIFPTLFFLNAVLLLAAYCSLPTAAHAQKVAILTPENNEQTENFSQKLENSFSGKFKILDKSLSETAFNAAAFENPFNLSLKEAKNSGAAVGCDYFLLIKANTLRRFSLVKKEFYESYAAVYLVSSRSGRLIFWKLARGEAENAAEAEKRLLSLAEDAALEISDKIKKAQKDETDEKDAPVLEELPEDDSPDAKNFRPPLPFKRFRPQYTETANLYNIEATVDILLDVDENGEILRT
jgi:hypothetical protein